MRYLSLSSKNKKREETRDMHNKSPMERMNDTCENSEIWFDASPLVYEKWKNSCIKEAQAERKDEIAAWMERYYNAANPLEQLIRGVTTNPPLSWAAVKDDLTFWTEWVLEKKRLDPRLDSHTIWWRLYKETIQRGAERFLALFRRSGFKYGWLSGQVDPRTYNDEDAMIAQAAEISSLSSNVMVKIPATELGMKVIETLTAQGISTNATLGVILPQFMAVAEAVKKGMQKAISRGVDLSRWRSVITMMVGRYEELGTFMEEAEKNRVEVSDADIKWASIAILKRALHLLKAEAYPGKMLLGSMRPGPQIDGLTRLWYFEKLAGADVVFTCGPKFIKAVDLLGSHIEFDSSAINDAVPESVLKKLKRLPYFSEGYEPDGMAPPDFIRHPAVKKSLDGFIQATEEMEDFVHKTLNA
jgi:transaldolase